MFHTHTVAGIVISFALFVIFYAGAVALFMDELYQWENPEARIAFVDPNTVDYNKVLHIVEQNVPNFDKDKRFSMTPPTTTDPLITFYGSKKVDTLNKRFVGYINPSTYAFSETEKGKTHMASTIYHLHYFRQIPGIGIYLSGLIAFFFLFAVITGLLTHWKNIVNKFYMFTTEGKWKQIWTNGHLSLGFITLPFQLIYAVTGSLLGLSIIILLPSAFLMFNGDTSEVIKAVSPNSAFTYEEDANPIDGAASFNSAYHYVSSNYPDTKILNIYTANYGKEDGTIGVRVDDHEGITADGNFTFSYKDGKLLDALAPKQKSYTSGTISVLIKLHYATFGGLFLKIIYFILAMVTCYVIMSGVMIWRSARDNKKYTLKQRRFHHRVTKFYLSVTLSMFPALALIFLANILVPLEMVERITYVDTTFFLGWLLLTVIGLFWNKYDVLFKNFLLIGSIFGLMIPIANGTVTGDWLWNTLLKGQYYVFSVDFAWLVASISGLVVYFYYLKDMEIEKILIKRPKMDKETSVEQENLEPVFSSVKPVE